MIIILREDWANGSRGSVVLWFCTRVIFSIEGPKNRGLGGYFGTLHRTNSVMRCSPPFKRVRISFSSVAVYVVIISNELCATLNCCNSESGKNALEMWLLDEKVTISSTAKHIEILVRGMLEEGGCWHLRHTRHIRQPSVRSHPRFPPVVT